MQPTPIPWTVLEACGPGSRSVGRGRPSSVPPATSESCPAPPQVMQRGGRPLWHQGNGRDDWRPHAIDCTGRVRGAPFPFTRLLVTTPRVVRWMWSAPSSLAAPPGGRPSSAKHAGALQQSGHSQVDAPASIRPGSLRSIAPGALLSLHHSPTCVTHQGSLVPGEGRPGPPCIGGGQASVGASGRCDAGRARPTVRLWQRPVSRAST